MFQTTYISFFTEVEQFYLLLQTPNKYYASWPILCHIKHYTGPSKNNSAISLFNVSVNSRFVTMMFLLEYVKISKFITC
jgi:hypothetical protein